MGSGTGRAKALAALGASPEVQAMALLMDLEAPEAPAQQAARAFARLAAKASVHEAAPFVMPPQVASQLALDRALPEPLRFADPRLRPATAEQAPTGPMVVRTLDAITPWMKADAPFATAAERADNRARWCEATPSMKLLGPPPDLLPRGGALWRGRLSKTTALAWPLASRLQTRETIEITAEGSNGPDASGHRCYRHFLVASHDGPGQARLMQDTGRIELYGDEHGMLLRIQKRVVVALPRAVNERFGALLSTGLSTLLFTWGYGFLSALAPERARKPAGQTGAARGADALTLARSLEIKHIAPKKTLSVAVLGAGPAGLACAWLLSNPEVSGGLAWTPPATGAFKLKVTVIEKQCRPGGKAASGRRRDGQNGRIEEHGLHVLFGFYKNLLNMLASVKASDRLNNADTTLIPVGSGTDPAHCLSLKLGPMDGGVGEPTLMDWMASPGALDTAAAADPDLQETVGLAIALANKTRVPASAFESHFMALSAAPPVPQPMAQMLSQLGRRMQTPAATSETPWDLGQLNTTASKVLLQRMSDTMQTMAARQDKASPAPPISAEELGELQGQLSDLAAQLRGLARSALPANDADPETALTSELLELATSITIGLQQDGLFPSWAVDNPADILDERYPQWVLAVQTKLDNESLAQWLQRLGVDAAFVKRSRVLEAVTAGLFTTPDRIAAGTFVNGITRLLFTYGDAPYKRLLGGTGEAVIGPIYDSMRARVSFEFGTEVRSLSTKASGKGLRADAVTSAKTRQEPANDFGPRDPAVQDGRPGWSAPCKGTVIDNPPEQTRRFDAFVLALPPFGGPLPGLPLPLADSLAVIGNNGRATIGLQFWGNSPPRFGGSIISGLAGPFRSAATMDHLAGDEGPRFPQPPVYLCGDVSDEEAETWRPASTAVDWLKAHAGKFLSAPATPGQAAAFPCHVSVNVDGSDRYVGADVETQSQRRFVFQTGVQNLWLAGDWTRTALSCGSIEAAVTSGLEAARDLLESLGCQVNFPIIGSILDKETS